ncbi:MAG: sulfite exporter TauE/SafE family protein [Methanosphaera sp.]|nr:sulfite exporter TauE/SafE family protein [Methanosphaera sp.]
MDFVVYIILLLLGGLIGGLMAGLLGVGGGVILTPLQYALLLETGLEADLAITVSFATSLAVICVTMTRSTLQHKKNGNVVTKYLKPMMIMGFIGSMVGAFISVHTNVEILELLFGVMCILSVVNMVFVKYPENDDEISDSKIAHLLSGTIAGLLCGLLGVGGGVIMIPLLTLLLKYPTHKAVGTSSATIIATSLGGLIAYIVLGWNVTGLPSYSLGYVNIIQFIFLVATSIIISGYAAKWSAKIDEKYLKACHIIIVLYIGLNMIGII